MKGRRLLRVLFVLCVIALSTLPILSHIPTARAVFSNNPIVRSGWTIPWNVSLDDGIRLYNVSYNGVLLLRDARLAGIIVNYYPFYNQACYFYDELRSAWIGPPNPAPYDLYYDNLTAGGFQIRGYYEVPGYDYQQIWRFYPDGHFLALLQIGRGGCNEIHYYEPHWRLDFAIGSDVRNIILQYQTVGWVPIRQETVLNDTGMRDSSHMFTSWEVAQGSRGVFFTPTDIHETLWTPGTIIVVQDHANEIEKSHLPDQVDQDLSSYVNGESVFRKDIAVWYMSRHYDNPFLQTNLAAPVLTGLVFYASGY